MRALAGLVAISALAGCTVPYTAAQLADMATKEPTPNLCALTLMAPPMPVLDAAENELHARNATCDWNQAKAIAEAQYARQAAQAQQQAAQANFMNALGASAMLLQQSGPRYYSAPPVQTTCIQQGVFTNCNSY